MDAVVAKYDAHGNRAWTRLSGCTGQDTYSYGISADSNGNAFVTGYSKCGLDGHTLVGTRDLYLIKYNSTRFHTAARGPSWASPCARMPQRTRDVTGTRSWSGVTLATGERGASENRSRPGTGKRIVDSSLSGS